jgi:hypothetical protein
MDALKRSIGQESKAAAAPAEDKKRKTASGQKEMLMRNSCGQKNV